MAIGRKRRRGHRRFGAFAVGLALLQPQVVHAAGFNCNARSLSETRQMICGDLELSRVDEQMARRIRTLQRRQGLGLYLSIRYWSFRAGEMRDACRRDRVCVLAAYRAQAIALDRLQGCLDTSIRKRSCPRVVLGNEATISKNNAGRP
ncbi:MAG: hypothetical protein NW223_09240 [Hyphomicrobiaceae bacterium]|nr:hypothetical protein [Hyphomicrobiaceae bacterium]